MLRVILAELAPEGLAFSAWGLREGVLFERLPQAMREQDPLLAAITSFGAPRGAAPSIAAMIAAWTADAATSGSNGNERLRLAATMLSLAAARIEPNMRVRHATDWALDKRWVALDHRGRAIIATALRASCGKPDVMPTLVPLAGAEALREAAGWGLAIRLCRRIGAGSRISLLTSSLTRENGTLVLWLEESRAQLATDSVLGDLRALAGWLGLGHELRIGALASTQRA
jgi:exopolyphosphatase/guanosine-5'-triphosphate,3'-diphosphate pyrophosphatase